MHRQLRLVYVLLLGSLLGYAPSASALHPYMINFKVGAQAGDFEHDLAYFQIAGRAISNGLLRLEIRPEEKEASFSLAGSPGKIWVDFRPKLNEFSKYGELRFKARIAVIGAAAGGTYAIRLRAETDAGVADWTVPITAPDGKEFAEYQVNLDGQPNWRNAKNVSRFTFYLYPENQDFTRLIIEFESIRLLPLPRHIAGDKLALVDDTKIDFLVKSLQAFRHRDLSLPQVEEGVSGFTNHIALAKQCHQSNDVAGALAEISRAEELHGKFYPQIDAAWELIAAGERVDAFAEIIRLFQSLRTDEKRDQVLATVAAQLQDQLRQSTAKLKQGKFELEKDISALNDRIDDGYRQLDAFSPWGIPIRLGLSQSSCGRFSWLPADFSEGLLVHNLLETPNVLGKDFNNNTKLIISSPAYSKIQNPIIKEEKKDVSWVFFRRNITFKSESGRELHWDYLGSLLAPGIVLKTDADTITLTQKRRVEIAPTHMMIATDKGAEIIALTEKEEIPAMTENWMLLLWQGKEKYNPCLLVFEHHPEKIKIADKKVHLLRKEGIGHVGIVDYAGVMAFDHKCVDQWLKKVPAAVPAKCRRLAGIMLNYPTACKEFYGVDERKRQIFVRNEISYYSIRDDWNTKHVSYAPLPPLVAYSGDKDYPVKVVQKTVDFDVPTKYGPFHAAEGNVIEYRIPSPDFNHINFPRVSGSGLDERKRAFTQLLNRGLPQISYPASALPAWNIFDDENRRLTLEQTMMNLRHWRYLGYSAERGIATGCPDSREKGPYFCGPDPHTSIDDRVEPFTEKYYLATGWTTKYNGRVSVSPRCYGDFINGFGLKIVPQFYYYAKYSGDWDYIRQEWRFLKKIFRAANAMADWANLAVSYFESGADNYADMGPDSFKVPICFLKMAGVIGDRETYLAAKYLASKQALNRLSFFTLPDYMQAYSETAQGGDYCLSTGVGEFGCDVRDCANRSWESHRDYLFAMDNWLGNGDFVEDFSFLSQYPQYPRRLVFEEIPRHIVWPRYMNENNRYNTKNLYLRALLGDTTEKLWSDFNCFHYWLDPFVSRGSVILPYSILQGHDMPLYLIDWEPNVLMDATYDYDRRAASITLEAKTKGYLKLKSDLKPSSILENDRKLDGKKWSYDSLHKELRVEIPVIGRDKIDIIFR